jgi:hypothetical protein
MNPDRSASQPWEVDAVVRWDTDTDTDIAWRAACGPRC